MNRFGSCSRNVQKMTLKSTGLQRRRLSPNSISHSRGEVCDYRRGANPSFILQQARQCNAQCFPRGHGQEDQNGGQGTHFHFQLQTVPGAGPRFSPCVMPHQG